MKRFARSTVCVLALAAVATGTLFAGGKGKRYLDMPDRTDDRPFSHAVLAGDTLYLSGTLGLDPETNRPPESVEEEIRIAMGHIAARLELAGMTMDDLVQIQVFCPDLSLYDEFNSVYRTFFKKGFPARAFVGSGPLLRGARFEIQGVAVKR